MKKNIQIIICTLIVWCQTIEMVVAQSRSYEGTITVLPVQLEQRGDFLYINIDFILNDVKVKSARGVDFIPQLTSPVHSLNLPELSIKGRDEYLAYERWISVMSTKEKQNYVELANQNYSVTSNRYKNDLALLTDMLDASNMKLSADLALVNARINVIYSYYKMKYITHTL